MSTLQERITKVLELNGLSQAELGRRIKVERATVNNWIKGKSAEINAPAALLLSKEFNLNPYWVVFGHLPMEASSQNPLSPEQIEALNLLSKMPTTSQKLALKLIKQLVDN